MPYPLNPLAPTDYSPAYGGKPTIPSPISTATDVITGNLGNLGNLYKLAGGVNTFNQQQLVNQLKTSLPGYESTLGQLSKNAGQEALGMIPQDVINQLTQRAMERGTATGMGTNAPNTNAALLAALGKTSIDMTQLGQKNFGELVGLTPKAALFDPSKFFVTPEQEQNAQTLQDIYKSAPNPLAAAEEARKKALEALRSTSGGLTVAGGGGLPTGSPFHATNWTAPTSVTPGGGGVGVGAGGATGTYNVTGRTVGGGPASLGTGGGNTYMGSGNPMWADEYDSLFGLGGSLPPAGAGGSDTPANTVFNPVTNTSNFDPFGGLGSFYGSPSTSSLASTPTGSVQDWSGGLPGTETYGGSVGDLFSTLTEEDLAGFM